MHNGSLKLTFLNSSFRVFPLSEFTFHWSIERLAGSSVIMSTEAMPYKWVEFVLNELAFNKIAIKKHIILV